MVNADVRFPTERDRERIIVERIISVGDRGGKHPGESSKRLVARTVTRYGGS